MDEHGLPHDLQTLARQAERHQALRWMAGLGGPSAVGVLPLLGCGGGDDEAVAATSSTSSGTGSSSGGSSSSSCALIPEETAGPYPGDGSNSTSAGVANALDSATSFTNRLRTSQLSFPLAACNEVYATSGYSASVANLARISFASDNVFSDGTTLQMSSVSGNTTDGYVATLMVGLSA